MDENGSKGRHNSASRAWIQVHFAGQGCKAGFQLTQAANLIIPVSTPIGNSFSRLVHRGVLVDNALRPNASLENVPRNTTLRSSIPIRRAPSCRKTRSE